MKKAQHIPDKQLDNLLDILSGDQFPDVPPQHLSEDEKAIYEELLSIKASAASLAGWEEVDTLAGLKELKEKTGISRPAIPIFRILKYAAAIMLPIFIAFTGWWYFSHDRYTVHTSSDANQVVLISDNGDKISITTQEQIIGTDGAIMVRDSTDTWHYQPSGKSSVNSYNTIEIPDNKIFRLTLADGSKISLNGGSKLKYPTAFTNGSGRKVILSGEACFDVTPAPNQPFTVESGQQVITVLGTFFNVNTYGEYIHTTVANGRVLVAMNGGIAHSLGKGEQSDFNKNNGEIKIKKCDPFNAFAWSEGKIAFDNTAFREVMEQLGHAYNFEVKITTNKYDHLHFNLAPIPKPENISTILEIIKHSTSMELNLKADMKNRTLIIRA